MVVTDMDELIIPRNNVTTYPEMMEKIDKVEISKSPVKSQIFNNDYFFSDLEPLGKPELKHLVTQYQLQRVPPSGTGYSCKSIVDMRTCIRMHNHYCWGTIKDVDTNRFIDIKDGMNYHYKKCHLGKKECDEMLSKPIEDHTMERYQKDLVLRVQKKMEELDIPLP